MDVDNAILRASAPESEIGSRPNTAVSDPSFPTLAVSRRDQMENDEREGRDALRWRGSMMTRWERRIGSAPQCRLAGLPNQSTDVSKRIAVLRVAGVGASELPFRLMAGIAQLVEYASCRSRLPP